MQATSLWQRVVGVIALLVLTGAHGSAAEPPYDLTGTWRGEYYPEVIETRLVQDGTVVHIGDRQATIDFETGMFHFFVPQHQHCPPPQLAIYWTVIDENHLRVDVHGNTTWLVGCRLFVGVTYVLTRVVEPPATPTPTPTPSPSATPRRCAGDCNFDGRVSVHESQTIVRCAGSLGTAARQRCRAICGADTNRNGLVEISELQLVVNNSLRGCGP